LRDECVHRVSYWINQTNVFQTQTNKKKEKNKTKKPISASLFSSFYSSFQYTPNMPKIVSSSIVSSSDHALQSDEQSNTLHVYYCLCSEFILVIDADLQRLPTRRTDNATIVSNKRRTYKLTAEADDVVLLKRYDAVLYIR
jgi:hypothetical protein